MDMAKGKAPTTDASKPRIPIDLNVAILMFFTLVVPFTLGTTTRIYGDGDVSWHVAAGQWMIEHGKVPFTDPFSFSAAGKPWVAHEWLSELVMGLAYKLAGFAGLSALVVAALALLMLVMWKELSRWLHPVLTGSILLAVTITIIPFLLARPMVLTWPLVAFWTVQMMHARERGRAPPLWLAAVMLLWANCHASFALGLLLIGPFALEALLEEPDKKRVIIGWGGFGLLCLAACLVNPNTYTTLLMPIGAFTDKNITLIQEFKPTDMTYTPGFETALLLLLAICLAFGTRISPFRLLTILGMLHLALQHMRHQVLFIVVASLLIAPAVRMRRELPSVDELLRTRQLRLAAAAFVLLVGFTLARPVTFPDSPVNPLAAIASVPPELRNKPLLNSYSVGGPLILHGIRPFIDGRGDLYGSDFILAYNRILNGDPVALAAAQSRWNFRWALISTTDRRMLGLLARTPGWHAIRADKNAVTLVHD
jgi:hypothetical protein